MGIAKMGKAVDVICQHNLDGTLIPMRVRVTDDDGLRQEYTIQDYKDQSHKGTRTMPDGMYVTDRTLIFECFISVFGRRKMIRLYYEVNDTVWRMTA